MSPIHPGEILLEEFLEPIGISQYRLAKDISVPPRRINEIVQCKCSVSADTALRLSRYFGLLNDSGSTFNHAMILKWKKTNWMDVRLVKEVRVLMLKTA
jgi:addiction module HigA family antidote